ncbi:TPA: hypothetical protein DDW35_08135, partial [Candidatus Sumerlaeota bacterium]|nr:hypothetical protein [Candidatus Sumerlaeota bacterium]
MAKARAPHQHQEEPIRNFSKTLIDTQMNIYESEWELNAEDMGLHPTAETQWNFHKFTLHGGKQQGVDILTLNNGRMEFDIVLSRGMNILDASLDDIFFGWDSPVGGAACEAIHPAYVRLEEKGG